MAAYPCQTAGAVYHTSGSSDIQWQQGAPGRPNCGAEEEQDRQQGAALAAHLNSCGSQKSTTSFFQSFSSASSASVCALLFERR